MPEPALAVAAGPTSSAAVLQTTRSGALRVTRRGQDRTIGLFLGALLALSLASFLVLDVDWGRLLGRLPNLGTVFWRLAQFDLNRFDFTLTAFLETVNVTVLATVYSILIGLVFGALAARNLVRNRVVTTAILCFFTLLRAVPTPVWVLLAMVAFGLGPTAGIVGLSASASAFFVRAFSQGFEDIPAETIEALEATGSSRLQIFFSSVLPGALSHIVAWSGLRFEINFKESAILGMVGAGGIGFAITTALNGSDFGVAGLAIFLVFVYAYAIEFLLTTIKRKYIQ